MLTLQDEPTGESNDGYEENGDAEDDNVYCVCKGQEEGTMVGCEV